VVASVVAGPFGCELTWGTSTQDDTTGYRVYRRSSTQEEEEPKLLADLITTGGFLDTSADPGVTYVYQIRPYNERGEGKGGSVVARRVESKEIKPLPLGTEIEGALANSTESVWYALDAGDAGTNLEISWGGYIYLSGYQADGKPLFVSQYYSSSPKTIPNANGLIYFQVRSSFSAGSNYTLTCFAKP
jgi:hypothetical protein